MNFFADWRIAVIGLLVVVLGLQTLRLSASQAAFAQYRADQAEAARKLQAKADDLSDQLAWQRKKEADARAQIVVEYRDKIRYVTTPDTACPSDPRMQLGSRGVSDIVRRATQPPR